MVCKSKDVVESFEEVTSANQLNRYVEGENIHIEYNTDPNDKVDRVEWFHDDQSMNENRPYLKIMNGLKSHRGRYDCCVRRGDCALTKSLMLEFSVVGLDIWNELID